MPMDMHMNHFFRTYETEILVRKKILLDPHLGQNTQFPQVLYGFGPSGATLLAGRQAAAYEKKASGPPFGAESSSFLRFYKVLRHSR